MSRARLQSNQVDLLLWADIDEARAEVERAEDARNTARKRAMFPPIGKKTERMNAFLEATERALKAEATLRRLLREAGQ